MISMVLNDFEIGRTYLVVEKPFTPPDGSPVIHGKERTIKILAPATVKNSSVFDGETVQTPTSCEADSWQEFLRVENQKNMRIQLIHPETILSASLIS